MNDFETRANTLNVLISNKFGKARGAKARAATAVEMGYNNFVNMTNSRLRVPDWVFDKMGELPDYAPPRREPLTDTVAAAEGGWVCSFISDADTHAMASAVAKAMNGGENVNLQSNANVSVLFKTLVAKEFSARFGDDPLS